MTRPRSDESRSSTAFITLIMSTIGAEFRFERSCPPCTCPDHLSSTETRHLNRCDPRSARLAGRYSQGSAGPTFCSRVMAGIIRHGTSTEWYELIEAVARNCTCRERRSLRERCPADQLLADQRVLDKLLVARRIAPRLVQEEMTQGSAAAAER